jgi:DNA primase
VSWADSYRVLKKYAGESHLPKRKVEMADQLEFPDGTAAMTTHHKRYLEGRNFDPDKLGRDWGLLGTGKKGSYRHRIIIPIYHKNVLVSYQGRDITGDHDLRYKACPKDQEVVEHKRTIYGMDKVSGNTILILEGVADVWRMGYGAVATYGIKYTPHQLAILRQKKNRFILFDPDPQAQVQAEKLYYQLSGFPGHTELLENDDGLDPGEMSQGEADDLMLDIIGR